jgi:hypothetical protein
MTIEGIGSIFANLWWGITPPTDRTIALEADILCYGFLETRFAWHNINNKPFRCVLGRTQWLMSAYPYNVTLVYRPNLPTENRGFAVASNEGKRHLMCP